MLYGTMKLGRLQAPGRRAYVSTANLRFLNTDAEKVIGGTMMKRQFLNLNYKNKRSCYIEHIDVNRGKYMFIKEYEFRYGDFDKNGNIKISIILELLQDASFAHASFVGLNSQKLFSGSVACLLGGWRIRFDSPIDINENVTVKTGIMSIGRCEASRKYEVWQNNECKIIATAIWFTIDTEKHTISRVPEEFISAFESVSEPDNNFHYGNNKAEKDVELYKKTKVERRDIDTNKHLNNVKSVEIALDILPDNFSISQLQVKYRKEIKVDEVIKIYSKQTEHGCYSEIRNENDEPCVLVHAIGR